MNRNRESDEEKLRAVAYHEAGHAVVGSLAADVGLGSKAPTRQPHS